MVKNGLNEIYKPLFNQQNGLKFFIIILMLFVNKLPDSIIIFCQSLGGKLTFAILICYLVYYDSVLAVLTTLLYVLLLNEFNERYKKDVESFLKI